MSGKLTLLTMRDIHRDVEAAARVRHARRQWGRWHLRVRSLELAYQTGERTLYLVDLERCGTAAQMLDWIFQLRGKTWCSPTDIGHLADAFRDILDPQANLCSFGAAKALDPVPYLRRRYGWGQAHG